jgi:pentatricopeptide repeat protein
MKARFLEGDTGMRPDCISYSLLLNSYAQKMQIDDAEGMLWEMLDDFYLSRNMSAEPRTRKTTKAYCGIRQCKLFKF